MTDWKPIETAPKSIDVMLYGSYLYPGDTSLTKYIYVGCVGIEGRDVNTCCEVFNIEQFKLWASMPDYPVDPDEHTLKEPKE